MLIIVTIRYLKSRTFITNCKSIRIAISHTLFMHRCLLVVHMCSMCAYMHVYVCVSVYVSVCVSVYMSMFACGWRTY